MTTAPVRILVVDDEPPIRKLLRMGLGAHGYDVLDAPNGKSALELLDKKPSLVISISVYRISMASNYCGRSEAARAVCP